MTAPYRISNSEIQTFQRCRRKWWLSYIERWTPKPTVGAYVGPLALGSRIHAALEQKYKHGANLLTAHAKLVEEARVSMLDDGFALEKLDNEAELGRIMLEGYEDWVADEGLDSGLDIIGVEQILELPMLSGQVILMGKLDLRIARRRDDTRAALDFKHQPVDEPVLTPTGWSTIGDIRPGDYVIGSGWSPVLVIGKSIVQRKPIYRINFTDHTYVLASDEHPWPTQTRSRRHAGRYHNREIRTTTEIADFMARSGQRDLYISPIVPSKDGAGAAPEVDAYLLGSWIANGASGSKLISDDVRTPEVFAEAGLTMRPITRKDRTDGGFGADALVPTRDMKVLSSMGLAWLNSAERFIPVAALMAPYDYRLRLLRGLMDADGSMTGASTAVYYTSSERLADDVSMLVRSLGGHASTWKQDEPTYEYRGEKRTGQPAYRVNVRLEMNPFLAHKINAAKWQAIEDRRVIDRQHLPKKILSVEFVAEMDAQCLMLDTPDHLYVTRGGVLTHNTSANFNDLLTTMHMAPQLLTYMTLDHVSGPGATDRSSRIDGAIYRMLKKVKRGPRAVPPFYQEVTVRHNVFTLRSFWRRLQGVLLDMYHTRRAIEDGGDTQVLAYPTPNRNCTWDCPFFKICFMFDDGSGVDDALASDFVRHDPYAYYGDREPGSE